MANDKLAPVGITPSTVRFWLWLIWRRSWRYPGSWWIGCWKPASSRLQSWVASTASAPMTFWSGGTTRWNRNRRIYWRIWFHNQRQGHLRLVFRTRMPLLLRYVTLLKWKVVAPQRLFCALILSEYKYLYPFKKRWLKAWQKKKSSQIHVDLGAFWSRVRESNPPSRLGKPLYYRYTNPAYCLVL